MPWVLVEWGSRVCLGWGSWTDGEDLGAVDQSTQFCPDFYTCHPQGTPLVPMTESQDWSRQHLELNWSDPIFCGTWTFPLDSNLELCAHVILTSSASSLPMVETRAQSQKKLLGVLLAHSLVCPSSELETCFFHVDQNGGNFRNTQTLDISEPSAHQPKGFCIGAKHALPESTEKIMWL